VPAATVTARTRRWHRPEIQTDPGTN
jgi:hypothetical protein